MAVEHLSAYDEVFDFLTSSPTPEQIIDFRPSEATQERMQYLLEVNRNGVLTPQERDELDEFIKIEHFMRKVKLRAYEKLDAKAR